MPRQEAIRGQVTPEDGVLLSPGYANSIFRLPSSVRTFADSIREQNSIELDDVTCGRKFRIEIEKQAALAAEIAVDFDLPALVLAGGGTYIAYEDFIGLAIFKNMTVRYGSNHITNVVPEACFHEYLKLDTGDKAEFEFLHKGNLTQAERNTAATAVQRVRFAIPVPWACSDTHGVPISALANKVVIELETRAPGEFIQTDGTKPASLVMSNISAKIQMIHMPADDRATLTAATLRRDGINYLFQEFQEFRKLIPIGSLNAATNYTIDLKEFTGPVSSITGVMRRAADVDIIAAQPNKYVLDPALGRDITTSASGNNISLQESSDDLTRAYRFRKYYGIGPGSGMLLINWDEIPYAPAKGMHNPDVVTGHISLDSFGNKKLFLKSKTTNTEELELSLIARRHNWYNIQAGNMITIWT